MRKILKVLLRLLRLDFIIRTNFRNDFKKILIYMDLLTNYTSTLSDFSNLSPFWGMEHLKAAPRKKPLGKKCDSAE